MNSSPWQLPGRTVRVIGGLCGLAAALPVLLEGLLAGWITWVGAATAFVDIPNAVAWLEGLGAFVAHIAFAGFVAAASLLVLLGRPESRVVFVGLVISSAGLLAVVAWDFDTKAFQSLTAGYSWPALVVAAVFSAAHASRKLATRSSPQH